MRDLLLAFGVAGVVVSAPMVAHAAVYAQQVDWDGVVNAGYDGNGTPTPGVRTDPDNALFMEDGAFLSLGLGGTAVFDFGTAFQDSATVWEVTFGCGALDVDGTCTSHPEQVDVYVGNAYTVDSFDLSGFDFIDTITNGNAQGGGSVVFGGPFSFLALVDRSADLSSISTDGFDLDAVMVVPAEVPLPAALPLFGAGIALLGLLGWRRTDSAAIA